MDYLVTAYSDIETKQAFAEFNPLNLRGTRGAWSDIPFMLCDLGAPLTRSKSWLLPKEEDFKPLGRIIKSIKDSSLNVFYTWRNKC